jgi:hypothetical protein
MVDMFEAYGDAKPTEADRANKRAMQAHDFATEVNRSAMENALPAGGNVFAPGSEEWRQSGEGVIDAIVRRVLENQK